MGYSTKKQRPQRKGASNRAALEESKFFRKINNELTEIIESRIRENERLMAENAKLRELCKSMRCALVDHEDKVYLAALDKTLIDAGFDLQKLGIEVAHGDDHQG